MARKKSIKTDQAEDTNLAATATTELATIDAVPPKLSGDDILGGGEIELEEITPAQAEAMKARVIPKRDEVAPLVVPVGPGVPKELRGWDVIETAIESGITTREMHKKVKGGTLVWISRCYEHPLAKRSVGTDAIAFVPEVG